MTDIVERLRAGTGDGLRAYDWMNEAADEIERLRAERDMWRQENLKKQIACEQMGARIVALEAERDVARCEGIEAAAKWHDDMAARFGDGAPALAAWHLQCAAAMRRSHP